MATTKRFQLVAKATDTEGDTTGWMVEISDLYVGDGASVRGATLNAASNEAGTWINNRLEDARYQFVDNAEEIQ